MNVIVIPARLLLRGFCVLALAAAASTSPAAAQAPESPTTVVLVRHAEPGTDDPRDPGLSAAGRARADALLDAVADAGIRAVYTTQFRRTRETAAPVAEALGVPHHIVEVRSPDLPAYTRALLERIRRDHPGEAVLVVGHSNTVPGFIEATTGIGEPPIGEEEFDRLYVVTLSQRAPRVVRAEFGDRRR